MSDNGSGIATQLSPRVLGFAATAIQTIAFCLLNVQVTDPEAFELAGIGDVSEALRLLTERLAYPRRANGMVLPRDSQSRIAVAEIIADAKGLHESDPAARLDFVRRALARESEHINSEREIIERTQAAAALALKIRNSDPQLRAFFRRIDRVRRRQVNRLKSAVPDQERCEIAIRKLDDLFERYIERAMKLDKLQHLGRSRRS
jgi:hypothetical protein